MATGSKKKNKTVKIRTKGETTRRSTAEDEGDSSNNTANDPTNHANVLKKLIPTHKSENHLTRMERAGKIMSQRNEPRHALSQNFISTTQPLNLSTSQPLNLSTSQRALAPLIDVARGIIQASGLIYFMQSPPKSCQSRAKYRVADHRPDDAKGCLKARDQKQA